MSKEKERESSIIASGFKKWQDDTGKTQEYFATLCGLSAPDLSRFLKGTKVPPNHILANIASELEIDFSMVLFHCELLRCKLIKSKKSYLDTTATRGLELVEKYYKQSLQQLSSHVDHYQHHFQKKNLTLVDWPHGFISDIAVLVGDRREDPPHTIADLLALSASTGDLYYLSKLGLPKNAIIYSDKVTKLAQPEVLKEKLNRHLLIIGSPAANLAARLVNPNACFSFIIDKDNLKLEKEFENILRKEPYNRDSLKGYISREATNDKTKKEWASKRRHMIQAFARSGMLDPLSSTRKRAENPTGPQDFGVVTLCKNPWSDDKIAVLAAGIRGPATAASLKLLGTPGEFDKHPLGGVFEVLVSHEAPWEDRYIYLEPKWDTREYSISEYIEAISKDDGLKDYKWWNVDEVTKLLESIKRKHLQNGDS